MIPSTWLCKVNLLVNKTMLRSKYAWQTKSDHKWKYNKRLETRSHQLQTTRNKSDIYFKQDCRQRLTHYLGHEQKFLEHTNPWEHSLVTLHNSRGKSHVVMFMFISGIKMGTWISLKSWFCCFIGSGKGLKVELYFNMNSLKFWIIIVHLKFRLKHAD